MTQSASLGSDVVCGMRIDRNIGANPLGYLDACREHGSNLLRVIRHQAHGANLETAENLYRELIVTAVHRVTKVEIGVHRIQPPLLQFVGAQLFHQPDTAAFLMLIEKKPCTFLCDRTQRQMQLVMTVAAQRMEDISGGALRMNANEWGSAGNIAKKKSQRGLLLVRGPAVPALRFREGEKAKVRPPRREVDLGNLSYIRRSGKGM